MGGTAVTLLLIVLLLLSVALVLFAIYNPGTVIVSLPFVTREISLALLVALSAAVGGLVVGAVALVRVFSLRMTVWQLRGAVRQHQEELQRDRPPADAHSDSDEWRSHSEGSDVVDDQA